MVTVFGCRPSEVAPVCVGPAFKNAQARTRGAAAKAYGDFEFGSVVVMENPAWLWRRRELGE
jgi:hypothetical protein